jgi:hypothetical protein
MRSFKSQPKIVRKNPPIDGGPFIGFNFVTGLKETFFGSNLFQSPCSYLGVLNQLRLIQRYEPNKYVLCPRYQTENDVQCCFGGKVPFEMNHFDTGLMEIREEARLIIQQNEMKFGQWTSANFYGRDGPYSVDHVVFLCDVSKVNFCGFVEKTKLNDTFDKSAVILTGTAGEMENLLNQYKSEPNRLNDEIDAVISIPIGIAIAIAENAQKNFRFVNGTSEIIRQIPTTY